MFAKVKSTPLASVVAIKKMWGTKRPRTPRTPSLCKELLLGQQSPPRPESSASQMRTHTVLLNFQLPLAFTCFAAVVRGVGSLRRYNAARL